MKNLFAILLTLMIISCNESNNTSGSSSTSMPKISKVNDNSGELLVKNSNGKSILNLSRYDSYSYSDHIIVVSYRDNGNRVMAYNSKGEIILRPTEPNVLSYKLSNNIIAIQYQNQGNRVLAYNAKGHMLIRGTQISVEQVIVSDHIISILYSENGDRVLAYNSDGKVLIRPTDIDAQAMFIINDFIGVSYGNVSSKRLAILDYSGKKIHDKSNIIYDYEIYNEKISISGENGEQTISLNRKTAKVKENKDSHRQNTAKNENSGKKERRKTGSNNKRRSN